MFKSFGQDPSNVELIEERTFGIAFDEDNDVKFRLGLTKTKKYLVIQALVIDDIENSLFEFFQTKLTLNNLKEKSDAFGNDSTMDECYQIITNLFEENKVEIKDIAQMKYLKLSFKFDIKNLDINLPNKKIDIDNNILLENFQINHDEFVSKKSKKIESSEIKNEEKANAEENKIEENNENINENINNEVENAEIANNEERGEPEVQYDENYNNEEENANNEYQENAENQENELQIMNIKKMLKFKKMKIIIMKKKMQIMIIKKMLKFKKMKIIIMKRKMLIMVKTKKLNMKISLLKKLNKLMKLIII